jgi:hypothetical protein
LHELINISNIPLSDLKELGVKVHQLKEIGISLDKIINAGYTVAELSEAKYPARDLFLAEIKLIDIFKTGNYQYSDIKESYHQQHDPQLELLIKQCNKTFLRKTNPQCKYDPLTGAVINPATSKKGGRRYVNKSKRRINRKK